MRFTPRSLARVFRAPASACACAIACGACGTLAAPDYAGEPVLELEGAVSQDVRTDQVRQSGVLAGALWESASVDGPAGFTRMPVRIEFPALTIDVLAAPDAGVSFSIADGEPAIAEGYLHIVDPDTAAMPQASDFLATDYDHALVYVSAAVASGSATAAYLGGAPAAGFHVMDRASTTAPSAEQELLIARCIAAATSLTAAQAQAACTAQHLYQLAVDPDDVGALLDFRVEPPTS